MSGRRSGLEDLELSGAEAERLREAFGDPEFRRLFGEYAAELSDPGQRAVYEAEVSALERERGVEAHFLHPSPGWVLRTSQAGRRRCYVNICSHPRVGRPRCSPGPGPGSTWTLPHCLAPPREELRRPPRPQRLLYDVLFHPEALRLAARRPRLRRLLEETAFDALDARFQAALDRNNAVVLRGLRYKGAPHATLLRTPLPGGAPAGDAEEASPLPPFPTPYAYPPPAPDAAPAAPAAARDEAPTTPRWSLRHRSYLDLQDYRCCRDSAPSPVPRELVLTVELPLLRSAAQASLQVRGQELRLDSRRPAAEYSLRLPLPYPVDEPRGTATFDKAARRLQVTLPVLPPNAPGAAREEQPHAAPAPEDSSSSNEEPPTEERLDLPAADPPLPPCRSRPASPASLGSSPSPEGPPDAPLLLPEQAPQSVAGGGGLRDPPEPGCAASGPASLPEPRSVAVPAMPSARCPPFRCTQDERCLRLVLLVPGILPQSLRGRVGGREYQVRFRGGDAAAFALLLRFAPGNELAAPEAELSVSPRSALVRLAKAPGSAGLWDGFSFGTGQEALQERLFLTEDNVDGFLSDLAASCSSQATGEPQPQVEVLDVSEDKSQIRLKRDEPLSLEPGEPEDTASPRERDSDPESGSEHSSKADSSPLQTTRASGSLQAGETMGSAGWESGHCSALRPSCPDDGPDDVSIPEESLRSTQSHQSELACTTSKEATATTQTQLNGGEPAPTGEEGHSQSAGQGGSRSRPVPPVLKETDMRDGSVQLISQHTTHCPVTFQNSLLYELD